MSWRELMKLMTEVYCLRIRIQKMESELWNLIVKSNNLAAYTQGFQELTMMYTKMVLEEEDRLKNFIRGLPDNIQGNKIIRIPYRDEALIVQGDMSNKRKKSTLTIISCTKTHKYINKGCPVYLAQVTAKRSNDEMEEKRLEDVPTVRDFLKVFQEELPGLPTTRQVKFQIDMVPGATPVARAPYRLTPSEMQELSTQLQELSDKGFIGPSNAIWTDKCTGDIHGSNELGEKAKDAVQLLKRKLYSASILALPEGSENFVVYCDASYKGLGAVLVQREKVIAYTSFQLKVHKKNYTTPDLELRAVLFALKMWRHYLYGTKCVVFTDHKSFQHILDQKELNMRQRRWLKLLSDYDHEIRYHPGKANMMADDLSRKEMPKPL
nr:putative reverse transcriptase domain-containing protein [Tanacetum cinerariifolium]